jgi:hypothetical protein
LGQGNKIEEVNTLVEHFERVIVLVLDVVSKTAMLYKMK